MTDTTNLPDLGDNDSWCGPHAPTAIIAQPQPLIHSDTHLAHEQIHAAIERSLQIPACLACKSMNSSAHPPRTARTVSAHPHPDPRH